ncbi:hypothetical protein [Sphingopyxis flava]|uniref:DnaA N-terminal domain-containing protein n=1 Tax=Sphingopyxis flava TaxID=1507287 RepID=A0A1T4ZWN9_9SPHN|nr:hypothetical protein [Sphingopyxis flava]SKB27027.1 hypothetical protein SAMN06295937_1001264 [Sphingopyxis flava]
MSSETSAWAKEQVCGDRTVKAVLREIANWARPDGLVEFLSVKRIAAVIEVSPRTVQRCIAQLEEPTLEHPGRLGLLRRVERFREDGGQSACGFVLLGYQPPMGVVPRDNLSPPPDTMSPPPPDKMSGDPVTPVSPLKRDKILPPSEPNGSEAPTAKNDDSGELDGAAPRPKAHPLPEDWTAPPLRELGDVSRGLVMQWPSGAYETVAEQFRMHWAAASGRTSRKTNWAAAWAKWLITEHDRVMRAARAGTSFSSSAPATPLGPPPEQAPVAAKAAEDDRSAIVHNLLERALGSRTYARWIKPAAITFDDGGAVLTFSSDFQKSYAETNLGPAIAVALARSATPGEPSGIKFIVETPASPANQEALRDQRAA